VRLSTVHAGLIQGSLPLIAHIVARRWWRAFDRRNASGRDVEISCWFYFEPFPEQTMVKHRVIVLICRK
jgi:hypothetical protein